MMTEQQQLELTLAGNINTNSNARAPKKGGRKSIAHRADWWFRQMRQVVDRALDWEPAPRFRPEQIWFNENPRRF